MPDVRSGPDGLSVEASDLGWLAGNWPGVVTLKVDGLPRDFLRDGPVVDREGELLYFRYADASGSGDFLRVWND